MDEYGLGSPLWMAKKIVTLAPAMLLRKAVIDVIDHLDQSGSNGGTSPYEVIDRIVQVASSGEYKEPPAEEVLRKVVPLQDGKLSPEGEAQVAEFLEQLGGLPESEEDESYEDFLRRLGIPDEDEDEDDEDE